MDLKNCITTVFILFLLLAVPSFSKDGVNSKVYDIDYRGPETHSHRPPPDRTGRDDPHSNFKKHPQVRRRSARNAIVKGQKA